jgi:hypothetical protein
VAGETSEVLSANVVHAGQATAPYPVVRGIGRTLQFYQRSVVVLAFSPGASRIDRTHYRHPNIFVPPLGAGTNVVTKPAKLQNL